MRRAAAAALAGAVLLCGCGFGGGGADGGSPAQRTDRPPSNQEQLQAVLDERAKSLLEGRPAAYAATATGAQRRRDRGDGQVAARLALRDVRYQLRSADISGTRASLRVAASWGITGVRGTFVTGRRMRAVREKEGWRIAAVRDTRGRPPWEVGDYRQRELGHFTVLAPDEAGVDAAALADTLAAGYGAVADALPGATLRERYLVVVAGTPEDARRLTTDIRGVEGLAALSDTAVHEAGPARRVTDVVSQRLLVIWSSFAALGDEQRRRVVAHELTHAVLAGVTSGRTPGWLVEGIALYVSGDRRSDQVSAALNGLAGEEGAVASGEFSLARLSAPDAIGGLSGARQAGAYAYASAATFALADNYGSRAVLRLYDVFNHASLRGLPGPGLLDRALRRVIGKGTAAFEDELRAGLL